MDKKDNELKSLYYLAYRRNWSENKIFHPHLHLTYQVTNKKVRIFVPKRGELTGGGGHTEGFHSLYPDSNIITMIKSGRMRWAEHTAHTAEINAYRILVRKPKGKRPLVQPSFTWKGKVVHVLNQVPHHDDVSCACTMP
jgi:hypothetical protein